MWKVLYGQLTSSIYELRWEHNQDDDYTDHIALVADFAINLSEYDVLYLCLQTAAAVELPGANSSAYCKYNNQGLQAFTSVLFLVGHFPHFTSTHFTFHIYFG